MIDVKNDATEHSATNNGDATSIEDNGSSNISITTAGKKVLITHTRTVDSSTRIRTRRVGSSDASVVLNSQAFDITTVKRTRTVTTRRWSGPRIDSAIIEGNSQSVFGANIFDFIPTDSEVVKWIDDSNSFIKENNFGAVHNQIDAHADENAPGNRSESLVQSSNENTLDNHDRNQRVSDVSANHSTDGAKSFTIAHAPIFTQDEVDHV